MRKTHIFKTEEMTPEYLQMAAGALAQGAVAVVPTDTVYGVGTGAFCEESILQIYRLKERPTGVPLQILTGSVAQARDVAVFSDRAEQCARAFWPGALTMILPPNEKGRALTRGFEGLGLRVPGNKFLVDLLVRMAGPMACTSANLHGQPTLIDEKSILETFDGKVDFIFLGGTLSPVSSSVVNLTANPTLIREGGVSKTKLEQVLGQPLRVL